jgi:hypothetical protein
VNKLVIAMLLAGGVATIYGQSESVLTRNLRLGTGKKVFTSVVLINTHSRNYADEVDSPGAPSGSAVANRCSLDEKTPGVIWKVVLHGAAVPANEISLADETGREYAHVCWSSSGSVAQLDARGNRMRGVPQTAFMVVMPDAVSQITIKYGWAAAIVTVSP